MAYYPDVPLATQMNTAMGGDSDVPTVPGHRAASVSLSLEEGSRKTRGTPEKDGITTTIFELLIPEYSVYML